MARENVVKRSKRRNWFVPLAGACAVAVVLTACSSDDKEPSEQQPTSTTAETRPKVAAEFQEYCDAAWDLNELDGFPSTQQIQQLVDLAPADISEPLGVAGPQLIAAGDDVVAQFNAFAADDVEAALLTVNAWETENCKIQHEDGPGEGASRVVEAGAARKDVVLREYEFDFAEPVTAGRTSFVMINEGAEAHFMVLFKLADGVTLEDAMGSQDGKGIEGQWSSGFAAAGGGDEEVLTVDLEPGTYAMVCFVSDPDGKGHDELGMTKEFTVV